MEFGITREKQSFNPFDWLEDSILARVYAERYGALCEAADRFNCLSKVHSESQIDKRSHSFNLSAYNPIRFSPLFFTSMEFDRLGNSVYLNFFDASENGRVFLNFGELPSNVGDLKYLIIDSLDRMNFQDAFEYASGIKPKVGKLFSRIMGGPVFNFASNFKQIKRFSLINLDGDASFVEVRGRTLSPKVVSAVNINCKVLRTNLGFALYGGEKTYFKDAFEWPRVVAYDGEGELETDEHFYRIAELRFVYRAEVSGRDVSVEDGKVRRLVESFEPAYNYSRLFQIEICEAKYVNGIFSQDLILVPEPDFYKHALNGNPLHLGYFSNFVRDFERAVVAL